MKKYVPMLLLLFVVAIFAGCSADDGSIKPDPDAVDATVTE